ncbi:MAG: phosphatase PAP2 family protein [Actinomycetales bacterium]|nr:phosphatase PAP2 family protein [Actinomycetales bacterium]
MAEPSRVPGPSASVVAGIALVLWAGFAGLTWVVSSADAATGALGANGLLVSDIRLAVRLHEMAVENAWLVGLGRVLDVLGSTPFCASLVAAVSVLLLVGGALKRPWDVWTYALAVLLTSAIGGGLITPWLKAVLDRERPPWNGLWLTEESASFPSGHAQAGITVWVATGMVVLLVGAFARVWWVAAPLMALGLLIGASRPIVGVHWPSDVLGGWLLGGAWLATSLLVWRPLLRPSTAGAAAAARSRR